MEDDYYNINMMSLIEYLQSVSQGYRDHDDSKSHHHGRTRRNRGRSTNNSGVKRKSRSDIMRQVELDFPRTTIEYNLRHYHKLNKFLRDVKSDCDCDRDCCGRNHDQQTYTVGNVDIPSLVFVVLMLTTQAAMFPVFSTLHNIYSRPEDDLYLGDFSDDNKLAIVICTTDNGLKFSYFKKFRLFSTATDQTVCQFNCRLSFCLPYDSNDVSDRSNPSRYSDNNSNYDCSQCILEWTVNTTNNHNNITVDDDDNDYTVV